MSDTAINKILQYGTTAARVAFTPSPAAGSQVLYLWYDTDSAPDTYVWNGAAWVQINPAAGGGDVNGPGAVVTDRQVAVFNGTTGTAITNSPVTVGTTGIIGFPSDIRQTFVPGTVNAGINVGVVTTNPSTPSNGDLWYETTTPALMARINGANVALGAGGGGGNLLQATTTLTNTNILAASTTPITVVAAPGSGFGIIPVAWSYSINTSAGAYGENGSPTLRYDSDTRDLFTTAGSMFNVASRTSRFAPLTAMTFPIASTTFDNKAVVYTHATAAISTGGNAANTAVLNFWYYIATVP